MDDYSDMREGLRKYRLNRYDEAEADFAYEIEKEHGLHHGILDEYCESQDDFVPERHAFLSSCIFKAMTLADIQMLRETISGIKEMVRPVLYSTQELAERTEWFFEWRFGQDMVYLSELESDMSDSRTLVAKSDREEVWRAMSKMHERLNKALFSELAMIIPPDLLQKLREEQKRQYEFDLCMSHW